MLAVQAEGCTVVTVEGLSTDDALTPLQTAFRKHHALQCGFCTPGMLTTAHALLTEEPDADADRIRPALSGNLCRCTGYIPIVEAVLEAPAAYQKTQLAGDRPGPFRGQEDRDERDLRSVYHATDGIAPRRVWKESSLGSCAAIRRTRRLTVNVTSTISSSVSA